jgi:hypothetical protein
MPNSYSEILTGRGGTYILNDTSSYTGTVYMISVLEDTIFDTLEVTDPTGTVVTDVLSSQIADPLTAVKAGAIITPLSIGSPFSKIELTSGSVVLVLK